MPDPTIADLIKELHVAISISNSATKSRVIMLPAPLGPSGSAFILRPDTTPPKATYPITITIEGLDASNKVIAIGFDSETVAAKGCNKLTTHLSAIPPEQQFDMAMSVQPGGDGFIPPVGDMMPMSGGNNDMAGCVGGQPDEDNDGRANSCDLCPADYDPTPSDSDGDGLPDACDPDPAKGSNKLVYFDPFDSASGHWSGSFTMPSGMSYLQVDSNAPPFPDYNVPLDISNKTDTLPMNVRVQTFVFAPHFYVETNKSQFASVALFLGDGSDPQAPGTTGVLCELRSDHANGDNVAIQAVKNGVLGTVNQTPVGNCNNSTLPPPPEFCFQTDTLYRLRLTQRGSVYSCDVIDDVGNDYAPATLTATPPAGTTQGVVLQGTNLQAQFHSVVVETALTP